MGSFMSVVCVFLFRVYKLCCVSMKCCIRRCTKVVLKQHISNTKKALIHTIQIKLTSF